MTALALSSATDLTVSSPYRELARMDDVSLESIFENAEGPEPEALAGFEWRGFNTPVFTKILGIQKFIKGFEVTTRGVEGFNMRVSQGGIDTPWTTKARAKAQRFGFFDVNRVNPSSRDNRYPKAVLLDYGASPRNRFWRIDDLTMKVLRDYVVQPDPQNPELMLGKAYIALGPFRLYSNFFVIERLRPVLSLA